MTKIFEALTPEAQEELVRDHVIELVIVVVRAVPDPDRPDDRLAMMIAAGSGSRPASVISRCG